jgi:opacity protein-like surface antigen
MLEGDRFMIKRIALTLALVAVLALPASALDFQQKQWYAQGILSLPFGNFGDFANVGFGAGAGLHVPHDTVWSFRGEASYVYYTTESVPNGDTSASLIPISVLAQYDLQDSKFYFVGGLSLVFARASYDINVNGFSDSFSDTSTEFGLNLGAGYVLSPKVDLGARFNFISDANNLTAHVAYKF